MTIKNYQSVALSYGLIATIFMLTITLGVIYAGYLYSTKIIRDDILSHMIQMSNIAGVVIDSEMHKKFVEDPSLNSSPEYLHYRTAFIKILEISGKDLKYLYSVVKKGDKYHFVLDSGAQNNGVNDAAELMEEYTEVPAALKIAYENKRENYTMSPYTDRWGTFISAYTPLIDKNGEMYAMFAVDMTYSVYTQKMAPIKKVATVSSFWASIFSVVVGFLVGLTKYFKEEIYRIKNTKT